MTILRMRTECWITKATDKLRLCNINCFSTKTMAARKRLIVTSYVHFLPCSSYYYFDFIRLKLLISIFSVTVKGKGQGFPLQTLLWPRGWIELQLYSSMTTALKGGEWSAARPDRILPPGKTRSLYRRLGGPQGCSGRAENLAPLGFDPRTVQPVVSYYSD